MLKLDSYFVARPLQQVSHDKNDVFSKEKNCCTSRIIVMSQNLLCHAALTGQPDGTPKFIVMETLLFLDYLSDRLPCSFCLHHFLNKGRYKINSSPISL